MSTPRAAIAQPRHRALIACLFVAAALTGFVACFAVWINRQALNTDNWTKTSSEVLANDQVDAALSTYIVNQLFSSVDVTGNVRSALPSQVQGLAGPATAGLRALAERVVPQLLATTQVQEAWRRANRTAHSELLRILNGGGSVLSTRSGEVTLDLHELVVQLGSQLGVEKQVASAQTKLQGKAGEAARTTVQQKLGLTLPPTSGRLVIMRAKQLRTAQDIATAIRGLAIVLPLIAVALFALAVWLSPGRRRLALRTTGWCFVGIGLLLVFARGIAGDQVVNGLVAIPANRPAIHAVWSIATSLLYDIATAMILYGFVIVAAAWSAGSTRSAIFLRRALAPWLREQALSCYAAAGGILLLIVIWGPTLATRQVLPVLGFAALLALGVRYLRRRTAEEFPGAQPAETLAALRRLLPGRWSRGSGAPRQAAPPGSAAAGHGASSAEGGADGSRIGALERLAALHERGVLTDEEFAAEKRIALSKR